MSRTVWVDITSAMTFRGARLSGIPRLELELAVGLSQTTSVRFLCFDHRRSTFVVVPQTEVATRYRQLAAEPGRSPTPIGSTARRTARSRLIGVLVRWLPDHLRTRQVMSLARSSVSASSTLARSVVALVGEASRLTVERVTQRDGDAQDAWRAGDIYLCSGLHRKVDITDRINEWASARGIRIIRFVYDLVPIVTPQFTTYGIESQRALFSSMVGSASRLVAISHHTAADMQSFCATEGLPCPPIDVVPPASAVLHTVPSPPAVPDLPAEFVLCVGTIEPRKNHHLLLDVWERMVRADPDDVPHLVIAGSVGWLNDETMHRLRCTPDLQGHVTFVEAPTDTELHWLYRNCLFTLYPSFYEGWGLPVSESLAAGKVCIASDRSSLPEAGAGVAVHLDATDRTAWYDTILGLHRDRQRLRALEDRVRTVGAHRTVEDVVADLREVIDREDHHATGSHDDSRS